MMKENQERGGEDRELIAERINQRKQALGLTQTDLKRMTGAAQATVSRWLTGKHPPRGVWMRRLAVALQTSADYLTGRTDDPTLREEGDASSLQETASQIVLEALDRIARGEEPGTAFAAATGGVERLTDAEREAVLAGIGQLLAYLNEAAGGDWQSLPPDRRLSMVEQLIEGEDPD